MTFRVELRRDAGPFGPLYGPWVRARDVSRTYGQPVVGEVCQVVDHRGQVLGHGLASPASKLRVRMLAYGPEPVADDWLPRRVRAAALARLALGFEGTTGVREVNSEGDALPGLIVDRFGSDRIVLLGTAPMYARKAEIAHALAAVDVELRALAAVPTSSDAGRIGFYVPEAVRAFEGLEHATDDVFVGSTLAYTERGLSFEVAPPPAQKTGAYFDQRRNHAIVAELARGHGGRFLDLGCHAGGFALVARAAGLEVVALDASAQALALARANEVRNGLEGVLWLEDDMFGRLDHPGLAGPFGTIVVDPPRMARAKRDVPRAVEALTALTKRLTSRLSTGGYLVLCSCSHHLGREQLDRVAVSTGRALTRVLALGADVDHPVSPGHVEGEYLRVNVYQLRESARPGGHVPP